MEQRKFSGDEDHLYLQLAGRFEALIKSEVLKMGDRLPSVRRISNEHGVSMSTVFQAYYHLENKGLIASRPRSGYYVRQPVRRVELPAVSRPLSRAMPVSVADMAIRVAQYDAQPGFTSLSKAVPGLELLPAPRLNKSVVQSLRSAADHCLSYSTPWGDIRLRRQIARHSMDWGGSLSAEEVVVTNGCSEALTLCLQAVASPGDTIAVESPAYFGVLQVMESRGLKVLEIPTCPEEGIELDALESAISRHRISACLVVSNFSNPLGSCMPDDKKKKLVGLLARHGIPLIEDDVYGDLFFGKERPRTCKIFDRKGLVLLCSSFSKTLAPGYRIGWTAPGIFLEQVRRLKYMSSCASPTLPQLAIAHFLENGRYDLHLKKLRQALHTQYLQYTRSVCNHFPAGTRLSRPQGGFVLWIGLDGQTDTFELMEQAAACRISISPGRIFTSQDRYRNFFRLSFGQPLTPVYENAIRLLGLLASQMEGNERKVRGGKIPDS